MREQARIIELLVASCVIAGSVAPACVRAQDRGPDPSSRPDPSSQRPPARLDHGSRVSRDTEEPGADPARRLPARTDKSHTPIPLQPRGASKGSAGSRKPVSAAQSLTTVGSSLAIVLGVFGIVAWVTRKAMPNASPMLPKDAVQLLGRAPLGNRQQMHLVRVGNKLVLLSVTPGGAEPLTEITDPLEVDRLCGLCAANQPGSISATFRDVLNQLGREAPPMMSSQTPGAASSPLRSSRRRTAESDRA